LSLLTVPLPSFSLIWVGVQFFVDFSIPKTALFPFHVACQFEMFGVEELFGDRRQSWNRDYRSAQLIYSDSLHSAAARSAIAAQHSVMYNNIPSPETGYITSKGDLMELLSYGRRNGKPRAYTYVLVERERRLSPHKGRQFLFRFSETGIQMAKDYFSKHAMHANASPEVVYAGEFHVLPDGGRHVLYLDNNSGTFAPDKEMLPVLEKLFVWNFPGLNVRAVSYDSDELRHVLSSLQPSRGSHDGAACPPQLLPNPVV